ncbi:MAG: Protein of unknown function rane [Candidatus Acidoferrum typicum]|nr:Protein of unknown function rane [Candidatus Acidoferrum typicum]
MANPLDKQLERWISAGVVDVGTAARIRTFEESQGSSERWRWPAVLALALGGALLCAGVLLFVAAHWDQLSPAERFTLVLLMVALFPIGGALASDRFPVLSTTFHAIGTVCLGAGIFLSAQIFNLEENWTNGILLWAAGALAGWLLLRKWPHAALLAVLMPVWLVGQWVNRVGPGWERSPDALWDGLLLLALTYFTARMPDRESSERRAMVYIGGLALLPCAILAVLVRSDFVRSYARETVSSTFLILAWIIAIGAPLGLALLLRRTASWMNAVSAAGVLSLGLVMPHRTFRWNSWDVLGVYIWAAIGAFGVIAWGVAERRRERINLGVAGFGITVLFFYFSNVMDKLGRAASLMGIGALLILGGWGLERTRRSLVARLQEKAS